MKRVAVTGMGIIDACGNNPSRCFENVVNDIDYAQDVKDFFVSPKPEACRTSVVLSPDMDGLIIEDGHRRIESMPRYMQFGIHATQQALEMAQVPSTQNVGVFMSNITHNEDEYGHLMDLKIPPSKAVNIPHDALSGYISQYYKFTGQNMSLQAACATGLATIDYGMKVIDDYDYVIVGGADAGANQIDISLFSYLRALGTKSMPFDKDRDGFIMGEGAGVLVLESEEKAKARGAHIIAWLHQAGHASDAMHRTSPSGKGAVDAMLDAIYIGGYPDVINAHGTSTPIGDKVEYESIQHACPNTPIYSVKGKIGHTFAAAGIIETIYSIMAMLENVIPPCHNVSNPAFDVVTKPTRGDLKKTLNNSFGFGGKCISQIITLNEK